MSPEEVVGEWLAAFNRGDADAMVRLYADGAVHTSPKLRSAQPGSDGRLAGRAALKGWWLGAFERSPGLRYELLTMTSEGGRTIIEYLRHLPGEASTQVAEVFEIQDGLIVRSHVYHG